MESTSDHGNRRLTVEQEDVVVRVVQDFSINNLPLSKLQIREMVSRRWALDISESWVRRFSAATIFTYALAHAKRLLTSVWGCK